MFHFLLRGAHKNKLIETERGTVRGQRLIHVASSGELAQYHRALIRASFPARIDAEIGKYDQPGQSAVETAARMMIGVGDPHRPASFRTPQPDRADAEELQKRSSDASPIMLYDTKSLR